MEIKSRPVQRARTIITQYNHSHNITHFYDQNNVRLFYQKNPFVFVIFGFIWHLFTNFEIKKVQFFFVIFYQLFKKWKDLDQTWNLPSIFYSVNQNNWHGEPELWMVTWLHVHHLIFNLYINWCTWSQ